MSLATRLHDAVALRFFLPAPELRPYVTTYYFTKVALPPGETIEDLLHPEWGNVRFSCGEGMRAAVGPAVPLPAPAMAVTGPTSRATRFITGAMRAWGIGLLPLGWARFVRTPACDHADRIVDGAVDPAFAGFARLHAVLSDPALDTSEAALLIDRYLLSLLDRTPLADEAGRILAAHAALVESAITTVADLAARLDLSARSLERLSLRAFGFPPKLLLRRQRFLRSLAQFMLDPTLKWISTLDCNYVDQAHFVRDFQRFMGMIPSHYAAVDHPVLGAAARARTAAAGQPLQVLHQP